MAHLSVAFRWDRALEVLAAILADESRNDESRQVYARAAELFETVGDADASSRCHDLATAAPDPAKISRAAQANDTEYGLGATVWTADVGRHRRQGR